jgi:AcrR family transcriptional regulator
MIDSSAQTRGTILDAATKTLQTEGFAGATSRAIARAGGFNQALIFYHFGSLDGLLLAALEHTATARLERYRQALAPVATPEELFAALSTLYDEDRASGHMTVVAQMLAGGLTRDELAPRVLAQMRPWIELAEETIARVLSPALPSGELAYAAITFYLGVNLLASLEPESAQLDALFEHVRLLGPLLESLRRN